MSADDRKLLETYIIRAGTPPLGPEWTDAMAALDRLAEAVAAERERITRESEWLTIADAADDTKPTIYWDGWLAAIAAVLAIVNPEADHA